MPRPEDRVDGGIAEKLEFEPVERKKSGRCLLYTSDAADD